MKSFAYKENLRVKASLDPGFEPAIVGIRKYLLDVLKSGDFEITYSTITEIKTTDSFVISLAGAFSLTVKSRLNGYKSNGKTIQFFLCKSCAKDHIILGGEHPSRIFNINSII